MKFNVNKHIEYRNNRFTKVSISNPKLLGLATIEINPTELCNRTCSFCPRVNPLLYPNRNLNMTIETAQLIVEQLLDAEYNGDINITGFGEPLLNKDIVQICTIFSKHYHTELITNGDNILNGKITLQDLEFLDLLIIDCYDGKEQVKKFKNLLKNKKNKFILRPHYDTGDPALINQYGFNNRGGLLYKKSNSNPCYMPSYKGFIDWNGDVRLCCNDWSRKQLPFGNIHNNTFSKIWMNNNFVKLRQELYNGNRNFSNACETCDVCGTKVGKNSAELFLS
jgi:sulfatase maturation enzyme AslB (radical SAM superfamily)